MKCPSYVVLENRQALGDAVVTTGLVRDLYRVTAGTVKIGVITGGMEVWENNPYITREFAWDGKSEPPQPCYVPIRFTIQREERRPYHLLHHGALQIKETLGFDVPLTRFGGDLHMSRAEQEPVPGLPSRYWVMVAGGNDYQTWKHWTPRRWQTVVNDLAGMVQFVTVGYSSPQNHHPRLKGVIDKCGETQNLRELIRLIYHAEGVVCSVTGPMHIAAALPAVPGRSQRQCVVLAGGVESPQYATYPFHHVLHTIGQLPCCAEYGCWAMRTVPLGDGENERDRRVCQYPQLEHAHVIPQCMRLISPEQVAQTIARISGQKGNPYAIRS